ncbi:MAG: hypothetical protein COA84_01285 [Robiginitomaculum sp.]|nr:MAG: hypothetical protein COA84_01285 [Robiginitomaculum sp.]
MITIIMRNAVLGAGILALSACATSQVKPTASAPADTQTKTMPQSGHNNDMAQKCKAMMAKMHEKMKSGDMDMAAMKEKMKSGDGMSDQQKTCHKMMHNKMHKANTGSHNKHKAMMPEHSDKMKAMPQECKAMMAKMHEKMKSGDMDMAAMKEKMKSGDGMSDQQKTCHKMMHNKMHKTKHDTPAKADAQSEQHAH